MIEFEQAPYCDSDSCDNECTAVASLATVAVACTPAFSGSFSKTEK
jgi:hypothetical protein